MPAATVSPGLQYNNGLQEYADWAVGPTATPLDFYTNPTAQGYYRDHVKTVINRVNTINGRPCEVACWFALEMYTTAKLWHCVSTTFPWGVLQLCVYRIA